MRPALLALSLLAPAPMLLAQDGEAALIEKARGIHERVITLDTHKDISPQLATQGIQDPDLRARFDPTVRGTNQVDFPKMREGHYDVAFYIVYVGQGQLNEGAFRRATKAAMDKFDAIDRMTTHYPEHIGLARTPDDVRRLNAEGKLVACIGIENGYPMAEDLGLIETFHERGARYMGITHNRHNQLGDSHTPAEPMHGGLTELGRQAIAEMNRVGIMVDISHTSKQTMLQALEASRAPVIASHSGCKAICGSSRNLDDEQLAALKENGGVIQCVALGSFVKDSGERNSALAALRAEVGLPSRREMRSNPEKYADVDFDALNAEYAERAKEVDARFPAANVSDFVDHIDYAVEKVGIDHVAIASDFDGGGGIEGWNDASETFNVTLELVRRGYTEEQIGKIWSGNTLRLWAEVEEIARQIQQGDR